MTELEDKHKKESPLDKAKDFPGLIANLVQGQISLQSELSDLREQIDVYKKQDKKRAIEIKNVFRATRRASTENKNNNENTLKKISELKTDFLEYIGLFVAVFTAISVNIQLLKFSQDVWQIAGLMFFVNTAPLSFFFLIRMVYKKTSWEDVKKFVVAYFLMFLLGAGLMSVSFTKKKENDAKKVEDLTIETRLLKNVEETISEKK